MDDIVKEWEKEKNICNIFYQMCEANNVLQSIRPSVDELLMLLRS